MLIKQKRSNQQNTAGLNRWLDCLAPFDTTVTETSTSKNVINRISEDAEIFFVFRQPITKRETELNLYKLHPKKELNEKKTNQKLIVHSRTKITWVIKRKNEIFTFGMSDIST